MARFLSLAEAVQSECARRRHRRDRGLHAPDPVCRRPRDHPPAAASDLTLVRMTPDLIYDQLIGMGCARKLVFSWGGNPGVGSLHRFRDAVENGWPRPLEIEEHSHAAMANAYEAGAAGLPCAVFRGYHRRRPAAKSTRRSSRSPARSRASSSPRCRAHRPDVAIIHAQQADREGNVLFEGIVGVQKEAVLAAKRSVVTVEEVVDDFGPRTERRHPAARGRSAAIAVVPGGAYPVLCAGLLQTRQRVLHRLGRPSRAIATRSSPGWTRTCSNGTGRLRRAYAPPSAQARTDGRLHAHRDDDDRGGARAAQRRRLLRRHRLPSAACNLARLTHAPGLTLIYESGTIATRPTVLPLSIGDGELCETALTTVSVPEMFRYWLQGGRITVGFLGGAQIDRFANLNTTVIGPYDSRRSGCPAAAARPRSRRLAARSSSSWRSRADLRRQARLHHLDGPRQRRRRPRADGRQDQGPDQAGHRSLRVRAGSRDEGNERESIHPGVTREQIQDNTGWPVRYAGKVQETPEPTVEELAVLRDSGARTEKAHGGARRTRTTRDVFLCDAIRTPIGRYGGALAKVRADDLAALPIKALLARNPDVDWGALDEVVYGCANQAGEDNRNVARHGCAAVGAAQGCVPGTTLNRLRVSASMPSALRRAPSASRARSTSPMRGRRRDHDARTLRHGQVAGGVWASGRESTTPPSAGAFVDKAMKERYGDRFDAGDRRGTSRIARCRAPTRTPSPCAASSGRRGPGGRVLRGEIVPVDAPGGRGGPIVVEAGTSIHAPTRRPETSPS